MTHKRHQPAAQQPVPELTPRHIECASLTRYDAMS